MAEKKPVDKNYYGYSLLKTNKVLFKTFKDMKFSTSKDEKDVLDDISSILNTSDEESVQFKEVEMSKVYNVENEA